MYFNADWPLVRNGVELIQRSTPLEKGLLFVSENVTTADSNIIIRSG